MAKVVEKRPDGALLIEVPAEDAADLEIGSDVEVRRALAGKDERWPEPFGALAGELPSIEIDDIKAARREALQTETLEACPPVRPPARPAVRKRGRGDGLRAPRG